MRGRSFRYTRPVKTASDRQVAAGGIASVPAQTSWLGVLGWAAYLACSWTWCIGMFLSVLLVRDYGVWGFVVFAVPNVVGAGAMGWVLTSESGARIAKEHRSACGWFSVVTVAFQMFFGWWLVRMTNNDPGTWWLFVIVLVGMALSVVAAMAKWPHVLASVMVWAISVGIAVTFAAYGGIGRAHTPWLVKEPGIGLALLAPVCAFGFALCPYLDSTFLRARVVAEGRTGTAAFTVGFGVLFLAMILFTLGYAWVFLDIRRAPEWAVNLVSTHIIMQIGFTIAAHAMVQLPASRERQQARVSIRGMVVGILTGLVLFAAPMIGVAAGDGTVAGLSVGEVIYRCFMSFYGLVFPAYVWLCMIPSRDGHRGIDGALGRRKLVVLLGACALAAPCYWMGFIERVEWWLAPGLGVVLVARLLVRGR